MLERLFVIIESIKNYIKGNKKMYEKVLEELYKYSSRILEEKYKCFHKIGNS